MIDKIERIMINDKKIFCEFLTCFYNKGLTQILCNFKDNKNFWFRRINEQFGINDMFIYSSDKTFLEKAICTFDGSVITAITSFENLSVQGNWRISKRRQFFKNKADDKFGNAVKLDETHKLLVENSISDITRTNYSLAIEFDESCYGLIDSELYCFASVSEVNKADITEISWIHTEPKHRKKGYASELLSAVSDLYANKGMLVTYHCDSENVASAKTALKSGFSEAVTEIILEKSLPLEGKGDRISGG